MVSAYQFCLTEWRRKPILVKYSMKTRMRSFLFSRNSLSTLLVKPSTDPKLFWQLDRNCVVQVPKGHCTQFRVKEMLNRAASSSCSLLLVADLPQWPRSPEFEAGDIFFSFILHSRILESPGLVIGLQITNKLWETYFIDFVPHPAFRNLSPLNVPYQHLLRIIIIINRGLLGLVRLGNTRFRTFLSLLGVVPPTPALFFLYSSQTRECCLMQLFDCLGMIRLILKLQTLKQEKGKLRN